MASPTAWPRDAIAGIQARAVVSALASKRATCRSSGASHRPSRSKVLLRAYERSARLTRSQPRGSLSCRRQQSHLPEQMLLRRAHSELFLACLERDRNLTAEVALHAGDAFTPFSASR
jgi:hypothetical protein